MIMPLTTWNLLDFRVAEKEKLLQNNSCSLSPDDHDCDQLVLLFVVFRNLLAENRLDKLYRTDHINSRCRKFSRTERRTFSLSQGISRIELLIDRRNDILAEAGTSHSRGRYFSGTKEGYIITVMAEVASSRGHKEGYFGRSIDLSST